MNNYLVRRATKNNDDQQLMSLYKAVFPEEDVAGLAEIMYHHLPGMEKENWYIVEHLPSGQMVSALALIPWIWKMNGVSLKVAEMGLVGTLEEHRGKGLQKLLNQEFDQTLKEEQFDLAVIQGIPGFYHKFGYHYAVPLENHINLPLELIPGKNSATVYSFRLADVSDIPFFMEQDEKYRAKYLISAFRNKENWEYLLSYSLKTECGAEYWIAENEDSKKWYYFKIPKWAFGTGLPISEVSDDIPWLVLQQVISFCKQKAVEKKKTHIRFNLHSRSAVAERVISMGGADCKSYAWQIKIPEKVSLLLKLKPILEERIENSVFKGYSGIYRLSFFSESIDLIWEKGIFQDVREGGEGESTHSFCISNDLFPSLVLGHRSWQELQYIRPEVSPELLYILPIAESLTDKTGLLTDVLFPACRSWIFQQY